MAAKSVTVTLRNGVTGGATLPDNRQMRAGVGYAISLDDYAKLSRAVRETIVSSAINQATTVTPKWDGVNYALDLSAATYHNTAALPPKTSNLAAAYDTYAKAAALGRQDLYFKLGDIVQGFDGAAFRLVKLTGTGGVAATTTKNVAIWYNTDANEVSVNTVGGDTGEFAGVLVGAVTAGRYGWLQISGVADNAAAETSVDGGEPAFISATNDGRIDSGLKNEVQVITLSSFGGTDSFTITFNGQTTAPIVRGTNAAAADVLAALEGLNNIAPGDVSVTGTTDAGPYTVSFLEGGAYEGTNVAAMTITGTGCSGTVATTVAGGAAQGAIGTALGPVAGNPAVAPLEIRSDLVTNRHIKRPKLFFDK